jgi:hypothetical protein
MVWRSSYNKVEIKLAEPEEELNWLKNGCGAEEKS